jgi:FG-GAP-like repeat
VNGDGKPDLLVTNQQQNACAHSAVGVLLGNGDGTFQTAMNYCTGATGTDSIAVAHVNGDGNPDLLVAHTCGKLFVIAARL